MHYFVDGYNLLFHSMEAEEQLQKQRESLIKDLTHRFEILHLDVTIVFDAPLSPGLAQRSRTDLIEVVYTASGESADSYIVSELQAMPKVRQQTVVTSDKRLAWQIRRLGATTVEVVTFLTWLDSRYRNKMRKLRKKPKELPVEYPNPVRVPPPHKEEPPAKTSSPEECLFYYQAAFEKSLAEAPKEEVRKTAAKAETPATPAKKKRKDREKPPEDQETSSLSEEERWLKLFTRRLDDPQQP